METSLKKKFDSYEIILIDDGSNDGSRELLDKEAEKNGHVKVYHFKKKYKSKERNYGKKVC